MTSKHDADQAGGVEFFTSEGTTVDPIQFPSYDATKGDDALVVDDSPNMTAEAAFEVFAGKLFAVNPYNKKKTEATAESPLQRLARIQAELEDLQTISTLDTDLTNTLHGQIQHLSQVHAQRQEYLTATIQASMVEPVEPSAPPPPPGPKTTSSSSDVLTARVQALEEQQPPDLETLQKQAKVIRQDLEAAAKARNKLASSNSSMEDSKAIAALYDQLQQLQGIGRHLPVLTERLQTLAAQHVQVGSQQVRMQAVEASARQLAEQVGSIEASVERLDGLLTENAKTMQSSVEDLLQRLEKL